jgi:hypothetical protein
VIFAGGLGLSGGKALIDKSTFSQNNSADQGGGLDARDYLSLIIRSSEFLGNGALSTALDRGGGAMHLAMLDDSITRVIATTIAGNTAKVGGGIFVEGGLGRLEIIGSKVTNNQAESGGGIAVAPEGVTDNSADLSIVRSKLTGNFVKTGFGGAVFLAGTGEFTMEFSQVIQNRASSGGGLALLNSSQSTIIGSVIAGNSGAEAGGGIAATASIELRGTRILGNSAGVGGGITTTADVDLNLSIVSGNFATAGGGIAQQTGTHLTSKRSTIGGNFGLDGKQILEF